MALTIACLAGKSTIVLASDVWQPSLDQGAPGAQPPWRWDLRAVGGVATGYVPPLRAGERERSSAGVVGRLWVLPRVEIAAKWGWLRDRVPDGAAVSGPGDLEIATRVEVVRRAGLHVDAAWAVKLPNAEDEIELGTDETDVTLVVSSGFESGPWSAAATAGLSIQGNPLRFADQDDIPVLRVGAAWSQGVVAAMAEAALDARTSRNPPRAHIGGELRLGPGPYGLVACYGGLTPADADLAVLAGVGWSFGSRAGAGSPAESPPTRPLPGNTLRE